VLIEPRAQRLALQELQREERDPILIRRRVVNDDDVAVRELCGGAGLDQEAAHDLGVARQLGEDPLHHHLAIENGVARDVDAAHPALAEEPKDLVVADDRRICHGRWSRSPAPPWDHRSIYACTPQEVNPNSPIPIRRGAALQV
jgi:hypothetical protein